MPDNRNRKRPIQVKFFVDEKEQALIKKKMEHAGIENMSAYIRKMVIDGYVVKLDMPELRELTLRMKSISTKLPSVSIPPAIFTKQILRKLKRTRKKSMRESEKSLLHFPR